MTDDRCLYNFVLEQGILVSHLLPGCADDEASVDCGVDLPVVVVVVDVGPPTGSSVDSTKYLFTRRLILYVHILQTTLNNSVRLPVVPHRL